LQRLIHLHDLFFIHRCGIPNVGSQGNLQLIAPTSFCQALTDEVNDD